MTAVRLVIAACLAVSCSKATSSTTSDIDEDTPRRPVKIQSGSHQLLLAVTDDDYAIYQQGETVYATRLVPHAPRIEIARVPVGNIAFPLQVGRVAFVWTSPQRQFPGYGVSPLVMFTAEHGAQVLSQKAAVALVAPAISPDSKQILFLTNVSDDSMRGDLVWARTADALHPTTLLHDIPLDFPSGLCRPLASFANIDADPFPIAAYCAGTDVTATLSIWPHGTKRDLATNLATPLRFFFGTDPSQSTFLVNLADTTIETVTTSGKVDVLDHTTLSSTGFITKHGTVGYAVTTPARKELRLRGVHSDANIAPVAILPVEYHARQGYSIRHSTSPDGSLVLYSGKVDVTGRGDVRAINPTTGETAVLEPGFTATFPSEIYTSDSKYGLYVRNVDASSSVGALYAANLHGSHQVSTSTTVYDVARAADGLVSYLENVVDPSSVVDSTTGDLVVADPDHPDRKPHVISRRINDAYMLSGDRRRLVFTTEHESEGPGLYVAPAR